MYQRVQCLVQTSNWDSRINLPLENERLSINMFVQSKLRLAGQELSENAVNNEFRISSKWKVANPMSRLHLEEKA